MFALGRIYYSLRLVPLRTFLNRRVKIKTIKVYLMRRAERDRPLKNCSLLKIEVETREVGLHVARAYQLYIQKRCKIRKMADKN